MFDQCLSDWTAQRMVLKNGFEYCMGVWRLRFQAWILRMAPDQYAAIFSLFSGTLGRGMGSYQVQPDGKHFPMIAQSAIQYSVFHSRPEILYQIQPKLWIQNKAQSRHVPDGEGQFIFTISA